MIYAFSILFLVLAVVFLMGKGDMLIAGYNTASEEGHHCFRHPREHLGKKEIDYDFI